MLTPPLILRLGACVTKESRGWRLVWEWNQDQPVRILSLLLSQTSCLELANRESRRLQHDSRGLPMQRNPTLGFKGVHSFLSGLFDGDLHAKRVLSLANASLGVIRSGSLAVHTIGLGLARAVQRSIHHAHSENCTDAAEGDAMAAI